MTVEISKEDLNKWADTLLNYSLGGILPEDVVMIKGERVAWHLISLLQDKVFSAGAVADVNIIAPDNYRGRVWGASIAKFGTAEQIRRVPEWHRTRYEALTKYIEIMGAEIPELSANLPKKTAMELAKADLPYRQLRLSKRWVITIFPTKGYADIEGMSLDRFTEIIVKASTTNPLKMKDMIEPVAQLMENSKHIRIQTEDLKTGKLLELRMDISNRKVVQCLGNLNLPDGEIFTSPDANSVEGEIFLDCPVFYDGTTIEGIFLSIKNGRIIEYNAEKGFDTLTKIVETDNGSHRIGEVALGMNSDLQPPLKQPLLLEKIGGTLHIAIGYSYKECYVENPYSNEGKSKLKELFEDKGICNVSSQHVDVVTDFRPGGAGKAVYLDDTKLEIQNDVWGLPD
jgi:aminopeptidase